MRDPGTQKCQPQCCMKETITIFTHVLRIPCLFNWHTYWIQRLAIILEFSILNSIYILDISHLSIVWLEKIPPALHSCLSTWLFLWLCRNFYFYFMQSRFSAHDFIFWVTGVFSESWPMLISWISFPGFSSNRFRVSPLTLRRLSIVSWFLYKMSGDLVSFFYIWIFNFPSAIFRWDVFSRTRVFGIFVKNRVLQRREFISGSSTPFWWRMFLFAWLNHAVFLLLWLCTITWGQG